MLLGQATIDARLAIKPESNSILFSQPENSLLVRDALEFADKRWKNAGTHMIEERNTDEYRFKSNCAIGYKAEIAVAYFMHAWFAFPQVQPDSQIYDEVMKKNFLHDLDYPLLDSSLPPVSVKSCDNTTKRWCGYSWTFQYANKKSSGGTDPIFSGNFDERLLVAMVYMDDVYASEVYIQCLAPMKTLLEYKNSILLKDPQKESLVGIKKCIYLENLIEFYDDLNDNNAWVWYAI